MKKSEVNKSKLEVKTKFLPSMNFTSMTTREERELADSMFLECKYIPKNYEVLIKIFSVTSGFRMISYVIGTITPSKTIRKGYKQSYVVNLDYPDLSELGEIYIDKDSDNNYIRV